MLIQAVVIQRNFLNTKIRFRPENIDTMDSFRWGDIVLGCLLTCISIVGVVCNSVALTYFLNIRPNKANNRYIRKIYSIISVVDLVVCATLFPIIEAAFQKDRGGVLFKTPWFCDVWGMLWTGLPIMSMFLIALLSVSRLLVIIRPTLELEVAVSWVVPLCYATSLLLLIVSMFYSRSMFVVYRPEWLACYPAVFPAHTDPDMLITHDDIQRGVVLSTLFFVIPGVSIIPVSVSAVMSVVYLRMSARAAHRMAASSRHHDAATVTILLVTLLYVLFNIPFSLTVLGGLVINHAMSRDTPEQVTVHSYNTADLWDSRAINNYLCFVVLYLCISLNSLCNPIMYLYRMKRFKTWVKTKLGLVKPATSKEILTKKETIEGITRINQRVLLDIVPCSTNNISSDQL